MLKQWNETMPTNDEIIPAFVKHYCLECECEVSNYAEHNADHTLMNTPLYTKKQLDKARTDDAQ